MKEINSYKLKYLKYKKKYLELRGGAQNNRLVIPQYIKPFIESQTKKSEMIQIFNNLDKVNIINGPNKFYYYNISLGEGNYKKILLFGENHLKMVECERKDNCIDFIKLLEILTHLKDDKCIDFFIEENPKKEESWNIKDIRGGATDIKWSERMNYMIPKLREYNKELQQKPNVRVQKWDLRSSSSSEDIKHDILRLNDGLQEYISNYKKISYSISSHDYDNPDYKKNIKSILYYLIIGNEPRKDVRHLIHIMVLEQYYRNKYSPKETFKVIKYINEALDSIFEEFNISNFNDYLNFLDLIITILVEISDNKEINQILREIAELKVQEIDDTYQIGTQVIEQEQVIYITQNYQIKQDKIHQISLLINNILDKLPQNILSYLLKDQENKTYLSVYLTRIFNKIYKENSTINNFKKAIETEILFYKEMSYIKRKINKSYSKFLKFCKRYPELFGSGTNIREKLIDIMIDDQNFNFRFNNVNVMDFFGDRSIMGLNSTLSDTYTFLRMFVLFDEDKDRGPLNCRGINTPQNIIAYSGGAHSDILKSFLDKCINKSHRELKIETVSPLEKKFNINLNNATINNIGNLKEIVKHFII